jgi:hypothetical protein
MEVEPGGTEPRRWEMWRRRISFGLDGSEGVEEEEGGQQGVDEECAWLWGR